jgi:hypothetical protein
MEGYFDQRTFPPSQPGFLGHAHDAAGCIGKAAAG